MTPLFSENGIGWYLWELMIRADQTRYQWPDFAERIRGNRLPGSALSGWDALS